MFRGLFHPADAGALAAGGKWMVSRGESRGMVYWRADGRELYFLTTDLARGCDPRRPALPLCDPRAARSSRSS